MISATIVEDFVKFYFEYFTLDGTLTQIVKMLSEDFFKEGNAWYTFATGVNSVVKPISLTIITICFLVEYLKTTINMDVLKVEYAFKCFFKAILAKASLDISMTLLMAIYQTSAEWMVKIVKISAGTSGTYFLEQKQQLEYAMGGYGMIQMFMSLPVYLVCWIVVCGAAVMVYVIAYARKIEIVMYAAISPLPCAFLALENSNITKRFIMSFASVCLQGVFIIMSIKLYELVCIDITLDMVEGAPQACMKLMVSSITLLMAVIKSSEWARRVLEV